MNDDKIASALGLRPLDVAQYDTKEAKSGDNVEEQMGVNWEDDSEENKGTRDNAYHRDSGNNISELRPSGTSTELATKPEVNLPAVVSAEDDENLQDIETVRQNIANVIDIGKEAMEEMLEIAKQSEQPRAFEVVSTLMKTLLDANKDYADISSKKKYAKEELLGPKQAAQTNVTNNNLIVSTADLLKMLKGDSNG
jgi:hypothetical protein